MKLFAVRISLVAMVWAPDAHNAIEVARDERQSIESDTGNNDRVFEVVCENIRSDQLSLFGWDDHCLPYGHDGNTRIKDLVSEVQS